MGGESATTEPVIDFKVLHAKIGQLALENDFFARCVQRGGHAEHKR